MQVKKFEAKSMKEALELVKVHMGPEAIILSAKDTHRGFGLMGEKSVEVTAAVSEDTLRRKKMAESKLREDLRQRFQQIPASKQREYINRVFVEREEQQREMVESDGTIERRRNGPSRQREAVAKVSADSRAETKGMRYIDIVDEEDLREKGRDRVRRAAERARSAGLDVIQEQKRAVAAAQRPARARGTAAFIPEVPVQASPVISRQATEAMVMRGQSAEIMALESQVRELKTLVERFQHMPQISLSMHPGAEQGLSFEMSPMYQKLTGQGVQPEMATVMLKKAQKELGPEQARKSSMVDAWIVRQLLNTVEVCKNPMGGRYHVFMGCTGQGKTTTLVKFASHLLLKEKKTIAIISMDGIKVGAADQLRIYAQILNVPFAIVRNAEEWNVAQEKLGHIHHILVDCPGLNLRTMDEVDWLKHMLPPVEFGRTLHYVQSILAREEETFDIAGRYQMLGFHDVIFTRLDESSKQGMIIGFQNRFKVPLHSFGLGSRIPEDFEFATKERVVDFLFKLSKVSKREESST